LLAIALVAGGSLAGYAQAATVTAQVVVVRKIGNKQQNSAAVVWLSPLQPEPYSFGETPQPARLVQRNKTFEPHLLVVRTGSVVQFPNQDPFFHNVFSLFEGKRFDLGLYEAGSTRSVRFDRPGISYIFCNIHAQMSAIVIALDTPYYGVSSRSGNVAISKVPPGRYVVQVWREGSSPKVLNALRREVVVREGDTSLGSLRIVEDEIPVAHKNKYGRDYDDPQPANSAYPQP
jgi:plastocyanin